MNKQRVIIALVIVALLFSFISLAFSLALLGYNIPGISIRQTVGSTNGTGGGQVGIIVQPPVPTEAGP